MNIKGGVSFYHSNESDIDKIIFYLNMAKEFGLDEVFTSFQFGKIEEVLKVVSKCRDLGLKIVADINHKMFNEFCKDLKDIRIFKDFGLSGIRLDYGFSLEEIAEMTWNEKDLQIGINALLSKEEQSIFKSMPTNHSQLFASFNYYPRIESGISLEFLMDQSHFFNQYNIPIRSFIAGEAFKRGPIFAGLPTVEYHRKSFAPSSSSFYKLVGGIDVVYIGDPFISKQELSLFTKSLAEQDIWIKLVPAKDLSKEEKRLLIDIPHVLRRDESEWVYRSSAGRILAEEKNFMIVNRGESQARRRGSITIDNQLYDRYMGELQIIKTDLPPDERVNVVARIVDEDMYILDYLTGGTKIRFYM
ncbi:DUF871 domain-containing protein [Bacillus sp. FJAT-49705]|uniref:DUF871 domain-containing protein n=1 Tax=Cytobacillus citreus TaxID=2833586 RepID=A0ABS5NXD1_9BACI|nr:MupG family TIM beta-alpha barrel fold protein [Cytobacillus citreus]MBS4192457.1 DUF871 domain-containing protein [Cytobacillus citreus]